MTAIAHRSVVGRRAPTAESVASFDVFDTVLTRAVGDPAAVARVVAERLAAGAVVEIAAEAWYTARVRSEHHLVAHWRRSATLVEIHEELATRLGFDVGLATATADVELAVERELSRVLPGARELVDAARRAQPSGRVIFVSDTALPSSALIELLENAGVWRPGDRCYASCEHSATKAFGDLYPVVAADLGVAPAQILHTGDRRTADVGNARLAGWRADHRGVGRLNRYEQALEHEAAATGGLTSWMAGASRLARLEAAQRGIAAAIAAVSAGVAAPLLVGFASWTLRTAAAGGIGRLYFLSRDGQFVHDVARMLQPALAPETECRYLHVSRRSMGLRRDGTPTTDRWDPALLRDYLIGCGFGDDVAAAIVDVGWRGNTNRVLTEQIVAAGGRRPDAYYNVGLGVDAAEIAGPALASRQFGWLFDRSRGGGMPEDILGQVALVEMFATAAHGPVVAYRRTAGGVEPVLTSERDRPALVWGLQDLRWTVARVTEHLLTQPAIAAAVDVRVAVWNVLRLFWDDPTDAEVAAWGTFPMDFDGRDTIGTIAQPIRTADGLQSLSRGRRALRPHESWLMASARRSAPPIALLLRSRLWWHHHGARLRRIPGRLAWELASRSQSTVRVARWLNGA